MSVNVARFDLEDARRIRGAATVGPWECHYDDLNGTRWVGPDIEEPVAETINPEDAAFIAYFNPARVGEMLDEIAELRGRKG